MGIAEQGKTPDCRDQSSAHIDIREIGDAFRVSLALFDKNGMILYMNRSFARECGVDAVKAVGQPETYFTQDPMLSDVFLYKRMICRSIHRMDGFVFITAIPIFDENGAIRYVGMTMENEAALNEVRRSFQALVEQTESSIQIQAATERHTAILRPLMGRHKSMVQLREFLKQIGPSLASVLITGSPAAARRWRRTASRPSATGRISPTSKSTARPSPPTCWNQNCSAMKEELSPGPAAKGKRGS